jgi:membrane associated rhomboid family serine protease
MAVCYRHPGRETSVACSNCGRPICPDCMTPTPVGMRCPECAGQTTPVRRLQTGFGGGRMPATIALIAINAIAFVIELVGGGGATAIGQTGGQVIHDYGLNAPKVAAGEDWRILTSAFLHAGFLHIALNMFALYILGSLLEPAIGTPRFLGVYFVSLFGGAFGALLLSPNETTVGASGAIFGLFSAAFLIARRRGLEQLASQLGFYIVINLAFTFGVPGISIGGHLGGLIGGGLAALVIIASEHRPRKELLEAAGMLVLGVLAVAGGLAVASA